MLFFCIGQASTDIVPYVHTRSRPDSLPILQDAAAGQPELAFEPLGRQPRLRDDAGAKTRRVLLDRVDDAIRRRFLLVVPVATARKFGRELLADEAGDMLARRGEAVVDGRGDQHLDDRRLRQIGRASCGEKGWQYV